MQFEEKIHQEIHSLLGRSDTAVAQWMLDKLLADYPNYAQAHHDRAILAHLSGDSATAAIHFQRAVDLVPENPVYLKSLGDFHYVAEGKVDAALDQYERVLASHPNDLGTLLTTAHLCVTQRRFDVASRYYQRVLILDPEHNEAQKILDHLKSQNNSDQPSVSPESLYESACRKVENGQYDQAVETLKAVVRIDPDHAHAHNDLAVLWYDKGDCDKASEHYERAASLMPENLIFQKNLADFLWAEKGDAAGALKRYIKVLTLASHDVEALLGCGQICLATGRPEDARDFIDCALAAEPWNQNAIALQKQLDTSDSGIDVSTDQESLYAQAQAKAASGDTHGAIDDLKQLLDQYPEFAAAYNDLGVLFFEMGDKNKALEAYEKAVQLDPHEQNAVKNLADFYLVEQNRLEDAMRLYLKVLEQKPDDTESLLATGFVCMLSGKEDDAADFYRRVIEIEPWNTAAADALAKINAPGSNIPKVQFVSHSASG